MGKTRDKFQISEGNLEVLKAIPEMMRIKKYRIELRKLAFDFLFNKKNQNSIRRV